MTRLLCLPMRWIISLMGMFSCSLMFIQRAGMSVAIVEMTRGISNVANGTQPEFDWDETQQGIVLGASFYLYWCTPIVVGIFTDRLGGKWFVMMGVLGPCILTALTPVATRELGLGALVAIQTLMGFFHGFTYPALFSLYVQWFPPTERSKPNAGIQVGNAIGSALMYVLAGVLCETPAGWPSVFYVMSALHVPWVLLWFYLGANRPEESRLISDEELHYIQRFNVQQPKPVKKMSTPWLGMMTSTAVWCSIISKMTCAYGFFMLMSKLPTFLTQVFSMTIIRNGINNAFGMIGYGVLSFIAPYMANYLIEHTSIRPIVVRKIFQGLGTMLPALGLALITTAHDSQQYAVALVILAVATYGFFTGGEWTLLSDYAPNNAGVVLGVAHSVAFAMGIVGPYLVGVILDSNIGELAYKWDIIFGITSGLYVFGYVVFLIFGTDQQQAWDKIPEQAYVM